MKRIFIIISLSFTSYFSFAQYAGQVATNSNATGSALSQAYADIARGGILNQYDVLAKKTGIDDFSGSPYTSDTFAKTNAYYNNEKVATLYYRYNALNEEVETKTTLLPDEEIKALMVDKAISIDFEGKKMGFKTFIDKKGNTINGYLTSLLTGEKYDLYRRIHVKFSEGQKAQNSFVKAIPNRFTHFTEYYYQKAGVNRIDELSPSNSKLLKLVEGKSKESVKAFLEENNLNIKNEADLIKAFEFLNQ